MFRLNFFESKKGLETRKTSALLPVIFLVIGIAVLNSCIEDPTLPILTTSPEINLTINSITSGGEITSDGGAAVTARGVCWGTVTNPTNEGAHTTDGVGSGIFTSNITELTTNTMYYMRAFAVNEVGVAYGNEIVFTTDAAAPELTTTEVSSVSPTTATSGGNITYDGDASITARGICWSTSPNPDLSDSFTTNGTGAGSFSSALSGLTPATTYFVRAYATNRAGVAYGEEISFRTKISDIEGNLYNTVVIGTQVWMAENLRTTKYNDNIQIPNITDETVWMNLTSSGYCWYNNNDYYKSTYGALYSWYTIKEGELCPSGWHVPTDEEFNALEIYLGMASDQVNVWGWRGADQGAQIKSTTGWDNDGNGTNTSGFTALPGGYRAAASGSFFTMGLLTYWWTATEHDADRGWYRRVDGTNSGIYKASTSKNGGKYIRCLKD